MGTGSVGATGNDQRGTIDTANYQRYVPIPGTKKTANCSYMEHWDASLKKVRYAREGTAAICYGASMYLPGKTPATVIVRKSGD